MNTIIIKKTKSFGKVDGYGNGRKSCEVTLDLEIRLITKEKRLTSDPRKTASNILELSICGNLWNRLKTDVLMCGQCIDTLYNDFFKGVSDFKQIKSIWEKYHLNDMNSGTDKQSKLLKEMGIFGRNYDYGTACSILAGHGLYWDRGYNYGHAWLYKSVPSEVWLEICDLFEVDRQGLEKIYPLLNLQDGIIVKSIL